jgi:hypothetical protein
MNRGIWGLREQLLSGLAVYTRMQDIFDAVTFLKRQGYIVCNSYRLNYAYSTKEISEALSAASGQIVTELQLKKLLKGNNIATA